MKTKRWQSQDVGILGHGLKFLSSF